MATFNSDLTRRVGYALAVGAFAAATFQVHAAGTWQTTLQGRDLDAANAGFEAYYDTALNITWLADANYANTSGYAAVIDSGPYVGRLNWDDAQTWVAQLNINGVTGWRLPDNKPINGISFNNNMSYAGDTDVGYNITSVQSELAYMWHVTLGNKSYYDVSGNVQSGGGLTNTSPFLNVQSNGFWLKNEYSPNTIDAWSFGPNKGIQGNTNKFVGFSAWAVHPGDVVSVPEPSTYALMGLGLAVLLMSYRRRQRSHNSVTALKGPHTGYAEC